VSSAAPTHAVASPDLGRFDAVLFDLDGVLTPTAEVHRRAWRALFSGFLEERGAAPYEERDYFVHLDGRQRYDGVERLLASRGISLPRGTPDDPPGHGSVCALGNLKNLAFQRELEERGVEAFAGALALVEALRDAGVAVAVVSGSRNARAVLAAAGIAERFEVVVDGTDAEREGLASKPAPDAFLRAAALLGVEPARAVVVEDAISGVEAGRAGGFGLVIGVAAEGNADALDAAGADLTVPDLGGLAERVTAAGMDRERFPVDEWRLVETRAPRGVDGLAETLFALGNGYLGLRGNPEEAVAAYEHGTFVNGFHETWKIEYPEGAYGFADTGQTILNVPDAKSVRLWVDGERLDLDSATLLEYERSLDMREGALRRTLVWRTSGGNRVKVESLRLVSFVRRHLALIAYAVTPLDAPASVRLEAFLVNRQDAGGEFAARHTASGFDPRRTDELSEPALVPELEEVGEGRVGLAFRTRRSGLAVAAVAATEPAGDTSVDPDRATTVVKRDLAAGETLELERLVAWVDGDAVSTAQVLAEATAEVEAARAAGRDALLDEQRRWCAGFWQDADVRVEGQPAVQQAVRFNLFQLAQAAARADGRGVSAKGVSGSGYSGHYFWDTEVYVLPFLANVLPRAAKGVLELRHAMLPAARRRAEVMSVTGALFPWRTINGEEASAYYPAGTAQYHIDADIAYAVLRYARVTGDEAFLAGPGTELLVETARMWRSLGFFGCDPERFHVHSVTGPDEYSAVVNDNHYTNAMARLNLEAAADAAEARPGVLGTTPDEIAEWRRAAALMALPYDERLGVFAQDAEFLSRERWDLAKTPREKRPLLLHYHPLVIYRHQVIKQADLVLAQFLLSSRYDAAQKRRDFEYYDPLTTGDSTLSAAVQAIMAAEVGLERRAYRHFRRMLWLDLADGHGNTADGIHVAAMGGTWLALVSGFGGLRDDDGELRFDPRLPAGWSSLAFRLRWRGSRLQVTLEREAMRFELLEGAPVTVWVRGEAQRVEGEVRVALRGAS